MEGAGPRAHLGRGECCVQCRRGWPNKKICYQHVLGHDLIPAN